MTQLSNGGVRCVGGGGEFVKVCGGEADLSGGETFCIPLADLGGHLCTQIGSPFVVQSGLVCM